jgi:exosome complex exonuclease DIS3/RRP44
LLIDKKINNAMIDSRHPQPPATSFETFHHALAEKGFELDFSSSKALADSLDKMVVRFFF